MWNRQELKERGKAAFKGNYWRSVGAALVLTIAGGASIGSTGSSVRANSREISAQMESLTPEQAAAVAAVVLGVVGFAMLMGTLLNIFLFNPLKVGAQRFFLVNGEEPANLGELGNAFRNGYLRTVVTMLLRDIFLFLWKIPVIIPIIISLTFIQMLPYHATGTLIIGLVNKPSDLITLIVSIVINYFVFIVILLILFILSLLPFYIKAYAYRMVPYILAENPDMSAKEAITLSRKMMYGHKWNTFLLDLSFIGWQILSAFTAGLVGVFYTGPYVAATDAELYRTLRYDL